MVRYMKLHPTTSELLPMATSASNSAMAPDEDNNTFPNENKVFTNDCQQMERPERFSYCIDRSVCIAREAGCDTIVISTHREAILYLS